jgi:adenylate cyclase
MNSGFWDGVTARLRPTGVAATVENPRTIVRIVTGALWFSVASAALQGASFFSFGEPAAGVSSLLLSAAYLASFLFFVITGDLLGGLVIALGASLLDLVVIQIVMGGYAYSGGTMFWSIAIVLASALAFRPRSTLALAGFVAALAVGFGFAESSLQASREAPDPTLSTELFVFVLIGNLVVLLLIFMTLFARLSRERARAEGLLLNVLPAEVAAELKEHGAVTARRYDNISVLFADIVGFTPLSAEMDPDEMVELLNDVFTHFDSLAEHYGAEKIRTIGDNYMVATGVPVPRDDHAQVLCAMAIDMLSYAATGPLSFRIGINSGPAVAGVIGTRKFQYDIWGDTVNTASRMESQGEPGRIQLTDTTYQLIKDHYPTTPRGPIDIKGKGTLTTYWLQSPATATP